MPPGGGNLQGPLHLILALDLGHIGALKGGGGGLPGLGGGDGLLTGEVALQLNDIPDRIDHRPLRQGGLGSVLSGDIESLDSLPLGGQGHGQHPGAGPELAGQGQLADEGAVLPGQTQLLAGGQNAHQHREIIEGAHLFQMGGGQVDRNPADREGEAAVLDGGAHPLPCLADGGVRQAHHRKGGQAAGQVALGGNQIAGHSV